MVPSLYVPSLQSHAACPLLLSLSSPLQRTRKGTHANLQCTVTSTFLRTCRLPRTTAMFTSQLLVRQLGTNSSKHNIRTHTCIYRNNCHPDMGEAYHVTVKETILDPVWHATYCLSSPLQWKLQPGRSRVRPRTLTQCIVLHILKMYYSWAVSFHSV